MHIRPSTKKEEDIYGVSERTDQACPRGGKRWEGGEEKMALSPQNWM